MAKSTGGSQDDISQLENLDDVTILKLLEERYKSNFIYTNCGNILIAVNPCKSLDVYGKEYNDFYDWKTFQSNPPPHIYHVAARAYRGMRETSTNQVILVCGESGAGKTESTKYMVRHFMAMCPDETGDLHERIIEVNPLLEAFGNAKTIMNSNSSRFAKYLELCFRADGQVLGATVRDYMLEKSRVVTKCHGEGNFHIFYALFEGAPKAKLTELGLQKQETYRILEDKSGEVKKAHDYKEMYNSSMAILKKIQMTEGDISIVHSLLAAVLHISQVEFVEMDRNTEKLDVRDTEVIQLAADCLCVDFETLGHALISTTRAMREETIVSYKSMQQAEDGRNALAKSIFERLFGYIVRKVNENLHPSKSRTNKVASIGLLDIAGFEKLQVNSFEQMCINLTNERLQNHMNTTVIVNEKLLYTEEGIPFADIKFQNNSDVVNLFNARGGILAILDEVTKIQQGSDHMFVQRVQHAFKDSPQKSYLTFDKGDRAEFCVKHFAGQVWYNCNGFREKNMDTLNPDLEKCLKESRDPFIQDMFTVKKGPTGTISATIHNWRKSMGNILGASTKAPKSRAAAQLASELGQTLTKRYGKIGKATEMIYMTKDNKSVVAYFQKSLNELLNKMIHAESYFVRCIKPNMELKSGELDMNIIKNQLKYNGILEIAVIRKMGFSVRKTYDDFIERYSKLFKVSPGKEGTRTILHKILPVSMHEDFRLGKHKVFMKEEASTWLEKVLFIRENVAARTITRGIKTVCVQKREERIEKERKERIEKEKFEKEQRIKQEKLKRERQEAAQRDKMNKKLTDIDKGNEDPESVLSNPSSTLRESLSSTSSSSGGSSSSYSSEQNSDQKEFDISKLRGTKKPSQFEGKKKAVKTDEVKIKIDSKKKPPPLPPARKTHYFWDIFQIITRENPERDVHTHLSLRIIKVVTYFLLFVILLGAMVIQKITLMTLVSYQISTNQTYHEKDYKTQRSVSYVFLMVAMCSPYALVLIISIWRSLFSNLPFPSIGNLIAVSLVEMLHSIGLCLLVFRVLPLFHMAQGIMLMTSTCILPSILKPLCSKENNRAYNNCSSTPCKVLIFVMDLVSIFVQMSAIPVVLLSNSTDYILKQSADTTSIDMVEIGFALFLSSFSWWENFIDDRFCGNAEKSNAFGRAVMGLKFDLQESRPYIFMVASAWKLITALVTSWLLQNWENDIDIFSSHILETFRDKGLHNQQSQAILGLTLSSLVGYYIAYTACKLKMQTFSFSLPLLLSTPITIAIVVIRCEVLHSHFDIFFEFHNCDTSDFLRPWYHVVFGTVWCISFYWIGRHIWFSTQERLAKVERLFMNPLYCGILLEQHLVMNRRRHNRRITKATNGKRNCYRLSKEDMKVGGSEEIMEKEKTIPPMIYACATMWHENRQEMVQILKSLYRMDNDQFVRRQAANMSHNAKDTEYYEFEVHILFDDAFEINDDEEMVPNDFVKMFCDLQNEACSSVHSRPMIVNPPIRIPSPYGGQLVFSMPGGNLMYVHLKDKAKIRHRKRWSQVMYMYYLLGYRIVKECQSRVLLHMENDNLNELVSWRKCEATGLSGRSQIFQLLDDEVIFRAENTFLLALDGDVDFTPGAVRLLMDRMCKNLKVGAACGRIHPIGKGPMVWYQKFEYATAHWLQKATEHVLGCVLCSPGCFSLFRGSALMDDNIMRKYTILPTEASHHLMYDQGEDRWLCTLLLQQGYRVDYAAASDAYTYAPEAFDEFFNQRRRWMPSTIANIMDLLQDGKNTVAVNNNISWLYIFYQAALMVSTIIGPSTVLMMIAGSILTVFNLNLVNSYIISLAPALFYFFICFIVKSKTQILIAQVLSAVYTFIMMVVLVGAIMTAAQESPFHPSVIFLAGIVAIFLIAALLHPREFSCIIYGVLYFLWVPSGFLLLVFYSLCNLHVVSWGTREVPKKKTKKELEAEEQKKKEETEKKKQGWFARIFGTTNIGSELKDVLKELPGQKKDSEKLTGLLEQLNKNIEILATQKHAEKHEISKVEEKTEEKTEPKKKTGKSVTFNTDVEEKLIQEFDEEEYMYHKEKKKRNELKNPAWTECPELGNGDIMDMNPGETEFWKKFIGKYLYPLDAEKYKEKNKQAAAKLLELRNNICAGMALINLLWLGINFMFQLRKPTVVTLPSPIEAEEVTNENNIKVDILGLLFVIFFLVIMLIQFVGMIVHRWGTFMHLIAITEIPNPFRKSHDASVDKKSKARDAVEMCQRLMAELMPDYSDDEDDDLQRQTTETVKEAIINLSKTGTKDNLGESRNAGLAKSLRGSSAMPLNALPESNKHTMSDEGFRSTVNEFLSKSRNHDNNPTSTENPEIRRRQTGRRTDVTETMNLVGRTIPRNVASHQRKFGYQTPYQKEFLAIAEERKLAQRYNMSAPPKISDASGAASLGQSYRKDYSHDDEDFDEDIYDEIPAFKSGGTLGRGFAKRLIQLEKSANISRNGASRSRVYGQNTFTNAAFSDDTSAKEFY